VPRCASARDERAAAAAAATGAQRTYPTLACLIATPCPAIIAIISSVGLAASRRRLRELFDPPAAQDQIDAGRALFAGGPADSNELATSWPPRSRTLPSSHRALG
jgi:hypothetical protein